MEQLILSAKKTAIVMLLSIGSASIAGCAAVDSLSGNKNSDAISPKVSELRDGESRYGIKRHVYAGLGIGSSWMQPDTSRVPGADVNDRVEAGGQLTLGFDVNRHMALEVHSADLGSAGLSPSGRINYHTHGASALLYAGKNRGKFKRRGLSAYGRLGVGLLENSAIGDVEFEQENGAHLLVGAGLEYMTRMGLGLRAEAISFEEDARYMQLGLLYRTGKRKSQKPVEIAKAPEPAPIAAPIPVPAIVIAKKSAAPVDTCDEFTGTLSGVNFRTDSAELTDNAQSILDQVATRLAECGSVPVRIAAHTDSIGDAGYNQALSERRANSVASYLSEKGINNQRIRTKAFGETKPINNNGTREGRRLNRRVELVTIQ